MSFDELPDDDPHGECVAEIHALTAELYAIGRHSIKEQARIRQLESALRKIATVDEYTRGQCRSIARAALKCEVAK